MVSIRSTAAALALLAAAPGISATQPAVEPVLATTLSGVVRDDVGAALSGVEILILAPDGGGGALPRALSDPTGRFVVGAIAPGVYRVAAIKSGYVAALFRVNTVLRSSIDLVLRPVPKDGQPGAEKVLDDLSWTLRVPPRSILRTLEAPAAPASRGTGGARVFASRVQEGVRGEIDHVVALGSWRPGSSGPSSSLQGNETRMRLGGALGKRGAIHLNGRRGSLDSSSPEAPMGAVSRGESDVDLYVSYDTSMDESLAMRAFYSTGELAVREPAGLPGGGARQAQRSWGYDATWHRQVDASSRVALQVGFHDANLDLGRGSEVGWDPAQGDASNRAIGAEGSYENAPGQGHLVRVGLRAQRLSLSVPEVRPGRSKGWGVLDGAAGWSLLVASEDQWSESGPIALTYGLAVRQRFGGTGASTAFTPRVGGSWAAGRLEARAEVSYTAMTANSSETAGVTPIDRRLPYGYEAELKVRLAPALILRGAASYVPSRANVWGGRDLVPGFETPYVTDGFSSDRVVAVELERVAPSATVSFLAARGRAEGALAPALDDLPVVLLSERALDYDAARVGVNAPHAGSTASLEYRVIRERAPRVGLEQGGDLKTIALEFAQDVARFAGGRASCRVLVTARGAMGSGPALLGDDPVEGRRLVSEHRRLGAGLSLAF